MDFDNRYAGLLYALTEGQVGAVEAARNLYAQLRQIPGCRLLAQIDDVFAPAMFAMIDAGVKVGCQMGAESLLCARQKAAQALFSGNNTVCRAFLGLVTQIEDRALLLGVNDAFGFALAALTGAGVAVGLRVGRREMDAQHKQRDIIMQYIENQKNV